MKKTFNHLSIFKIIILLILTLLVYFYGYSVSDITWYYTDNLLIKFKHYQSLNKNILEILINPLNYFGVTIDLHNPKLNFLAKLNYDIKTSRDYINYLFILRLLEISTILIISKIFIKKFNFEIIIYLLLIFLVLTYSFINFDHQSYIILPIIIFNFFIALGLNLRKKTKISVIVYLIGNLWSFLLNPMYFFIVCFGPLLFYYFYLILNKEYKETVLLFLSNLPFALWFSLISIGQSRFYLSDLFSFNTHYQFLLFESKPFIFVTLVGVISSFLLIIRKRNFKNVSKAYVYLLSLIVIGGFFYKFKADKWFLPPPEYLDNSIQYIYVALGAIFLFQFSKLLKLFSLMLLISGFLYVSYNPFLKSFINYDKNSSGRLVTDTKNLYANKLWKSNQSHFLDNFEFIELLVDLPNHDSEYANFIFNSKNKYNNKQKQFILERYYNPDFGHDLQFTDYFRANIIVNIGHSIMLDNSTFLANLNGHNQFLYKQNIPYIKHTDSINQYFLQIKYMISDKLYENLKVIKTYEYDGYKFYLYGLSYGSKSNKIEEIIRSKKFNHDEYLENIKFFENKIFVLENNKINIPPILCKTIKKHTNKAIYFKVITSERCLAIFKIPFSRNNKFLDNNNQKCETFRVQYYFHGCVVEKNENYILKKNNILIYGYYSLIDYLEIRSLLNKNDLKKHFGYN